MTLDDKNFNFVEITGTGRIGFLARHFNNPVFDLHLFNFADLLIPGYDGGMWDYYEWRGIPFAVLDGSDTFSMRNFSGETFNDVDKYLCGMVVTFFALTYEIEKTQNEKLMDVWDSLKDLIYNYAEEIGQTTIAFKMLD